MRLIFCILIFQNGFCFRYHEAGDKAKTKVLELLRGLSAELQTKINILVFASMLLVIAKALFGHVRLVLDNLTSAKTISNYFFFFASFCIVIGIFDNCVKPSVLSQCIRNVTRYPSSFSNMSSLSLDPGKIV